MVVRPVALFTVAAVNAQLTVPFPSTAVCGQIAVHNHHWCSRLVGAACCLHGVSVSVLCDDSTGFVLVVVGRHNGRAPAGCVLTQASRQACCWSHIFVSLNHDLRCCQARHEVRLRQWPEADLYIRVLCSRS